MMVAALDYKLKHIVTDVDRHGVARIYYRKSGFRKVRIRAEPGSAQFLEEYLAAEARAAPSPPKGLPAAQIGSFLSVCRSYFASPEYRGLDESTRNWRRRALELICQDHGAKPVAILTPRDIRVLRDQLAATPGAANARLKALKALFSWATEAHEAETNPAREVRLIRYMTKGHKSWTVEDVLAFERRHPIGTKAHLAMALMLYTACRREDAPRLGPQHIKSGRLKFVQAKNDKRKPVAIDMPIPAPLQAALRATPVQHLTFLATAYGAPFTTAGFGNWFRDRCDEAGLKDCSAHGLRKAMAARLAESDATAHQIGAITGHSSLEEIEHYTRGARKAGLADEAIAKLAKSRA